MCSHASCAAGVVVTRKSIEALELSRPLRVLQLSRWLSDVGGGVQTYLSSLQNALDAGDVELTYAALMPGVQPRYLHSKARFGRAGRSKFANACGLWVWLYRELDHTDVVQIHGATDWHFLVGALACLRAGVPYIVRPAGGLFPEAFMHTRRRRILSKIYLKLVGERLLSKASVVLASSPRERDLLLGFRVMTEVRLIPNGVSVPARQPQFMTEFGGKAHVLFMGRISPIKAIPTLMAAIAKLAKQGRVVDLDIVGGGAPDYVDELKARAARLGVNDLVVWHGDKRDAEKQQLLSRAHVLVLPSLSENFGFVVAEAMAAGLPVIVSSGVGVAEKVLEYGAGLVFPVGDDEALASALAICLDPGDAEGRSQRAYQCASKEFSIEAMGRSLFELYELAARGEFGRQR